MRTAPRRRWTQFSLRTLLLVLTACAIGALFVRYHADAEKREQAARRTSMLRRWLPPNPAPKP